MATAKLRTERRGIEIARHPYDRGYWARYNGQPRPAKRHQYRERAGWDECDIELAVEQSLKRSKSDMHPLDIASRVIDRRRGKK